VPFVTSMFIANISALLSFFIYFLLCLSCLSVCAVLLTVSDFSTYVVNKHLYGGLGGSFSSSFNDSCYH